MFKRYFEINTTPPRTSVFKHLYMSANSNDGNLAITLTGGWSEYKPEEVEQIITAMQTWLGDLRAWFCKFCGELNKTTDPAQGCYYKWVRCRYCKKKTPNDKLEFVS